MTTTFTNLINLINNATNSKQAFMEFIAEYCGIENGTQAHNDIDFLVRDSEDAEEFLSHFDGNIDTVEDAIYSLKESRQQHKMDLTEFMARCTVDIKSAFEQLFQESAPKWMIKKFHERLAKGELSLELIFSTFATGDKWFRTHGLSKILRSDWSDRGFNPAR